MDLAPDFRDLLQAFADAEARYLVIGGYAVGFHGTPRLTKDIELWVDDSEENLERVEQALRAFGAPAALLEGLRGASSEDVLWMDLPPFRTDIVKGVPGGEFAPAWEARVVTSWSGIPVSVISLDDLVAIKRASGRPQDLLDVEMLERFRGR